MTWKLCGREMIAAGALGLHIVASGSAAAYEVSAPGLDTILRGDVKGGIARLERAAKGGDARAAFLLFGAHFRGYGVPQNIANARRWLAYSRRRPISESLYMYGLGHLTGHGLPKDLGRAFDHFQKAARLGHAAARYHAGKMLIEGRGTRKDLKRGLRELHTSARQGSVHAQYLLAKRYRSGKQADKRRHIAFLRRAAVSGHRPAQADLYHAYTKGDGVPRNDEKALYWGTVAAGQGAKSLYNPLGVMYWRRKGVPKALRTTAPQKAAFWFRKAAEQGSSAAAFNMGLAYEKGAVGKIKGRPNLILAHAWYNVAARRGSNRAVSARNRIEKRMPTGAVRRAKARAKKLGSISSSRKKLRMNSTGTGFFVNLSHWVVTNEHVTNGCEKLAVRYRGRDWQDVAIIGARKDVDLALLQVRVGRGQTFTHGIAAIGPASEAALGEPVSMYGYPYYGTLSKDGVFTRGILNAHAGLGDNKRLIQYSAPTQPGSSGSAVYDEKGRVIAVHSNSLKILIGSKVPQNLNFGVKTSLLRRMIDAFHTPNYAFDEKKARPVPIRERAKLAKRNSVLIKCYGYGPE